MMYNTYPFEDVFISFRNPILGLMAISRAAGQIWTRSLQILVLLKKLVSLIYGCTPAVARTLSYGLIKDLKSDLERYIHIWRP